MTLNFKNVLCSYRGIKNIANSKFAITINFRNTKAPRLNYFRERKVFWRKKSNQQEDAFLFYFWLPCPPQALTKFVVSSRGSTPFSSQSSVVKRVAAHTKAVQELVATFFYETKCEGDDSRFLQHDSVLT